MTDSLSQKQAALRRQIEAGDANAVRALLASSRELAGLRFDDGATPLHLAAGENRGDIVDLLFEFGAPVEYRFGDSAHSPLSWAVTCWAFDAASRLVAHGVEPDLFCASGLGLLDRVKAFWSGRVLRPHPSVTGSSRCDERGEPLPRPPESDADQVSDALYIACRCERVDVARWLLDRGADPNWRGYAGATCLAWAEFSGNAELCALLRARGGSDELRDYQFDATPKAFAVMVLAGWGFPGLLLSRLTADRSIVTLAGGRGTALHAAAARGHVEIGKMLLLFGADRRATDPNGRVPADVAEANGHHSLAELLKV